MSALAECDESDDAHLATAVWADQRVTKLRPLQILAGWVFWATKPVVARMQYHLALAGELLPKPGFGWLRAGSGTMEVRWDLVADGLGDADYDRTSVAYGLSHLEVGKVIKAISLPKVAIDPVESWRVDYVDKDQCQM